MADKSQEESKEENQSEGGYLSSVTSHLPSLPGSSQVTDAAKEAPGKAQQGGAAAGKGLKDVTAPVPVVGSVIEGVGNAPAVQKLGGQDPDEKKPGYLGQAYNLAGDAVRTVYDAAGNAIGTVSQTAGEYLHGGDKEKAAAAGEGTGEGEIEGVVGSKKEAEKRDQEGIKDQTTGKTQEGAEKAEETVDTTKSKASETSSSLGQTASETSDKVKSGHRDIEDTVQSGANDGINTVQESTGTKDATEGASSGLDDTATATKDTARGVEDSATDMGGQVASGVSKANTEGAGEAAGGVKNGVMGAGSKVASGAGDAAGGGAETVKGVGSGVSSGVGSAASGLGNVTGLGGGGK